MFAPPSLRSTAVITLVASLGAPAAAADERHAGEIDPDAMAALERMGAFLRAQQQMHVKSETTTDDVLDSGEKVQLTGTVELSLQKPDKLRADVRSERRNDRIFYDGKTFTVYMPAQSFYASFDAPSSVRELVDVLEQRYGFDLPLADLFRWGTSTTQRTAVRKAKSLGKVTLDGHACHHYAFHQDDIDWQVWIEDGNAPVPRKLVITTLSERSQPQYSATLDWDVAPKLSPDAFAFRPSATDKRIEFDNVRPATKR